MDSAGSTGPGVPDRASVSAAQQRRPDAAGLVAAVTAYAYLWTCRRVGARARTLGRPLVINAGNVEIGEDVIIDSRAARVELACYRRGRLVIGNGVRIGPGTRLVAARYVEIGDRTCIGADCVVSDGGPEIEDSGSLEIWIGDGVSIGDHVRVLPGTVIGTGAVIAAGSVVSGRIPAGAFFEGGAVPVELEESRA